MYKEIFLQNWMHCGLTSFSNLLRERVAAASCILVPLLRPAFAFGFAGIMDIAFLRADAYSYTQLIKYRTVYKNKSVWLCVCVCVY